MDYLRRFRASCQKNSEIIQESSHLAVSHCGRGPSRKREEDYIRRFRRFLSINSELIHGIQQNLRCVLHWREIARNAPLPGWNSAHGVIQLWTFRAVQCFTGVVRETKGHAKKNDHGTYAGYLPALATYLSTSPIPEHRKKPHPKAPGWPGR